MAYSQQVIEVPRDILASEADQGNDLIGVFGSEPSVEVTKAKKGLNILDFPDPSAYRVR